MESRENRWGWVGVGLMGEGERKAFESESGEASGASLILRDPNIGFPATVNRLALFLTALALSNMRKRFFVQLYYIHEKCSWNGEMPDRLRCRPAGDIRSLVATRPIPS